MRGSPRCAQRAHWEERHDQCSAGPVPQAALRPVPGLPAGDAAGFVTRGAAGQCLAPLEDDVRCGRGGKSAADALRDFHAKVIASRPGDPVVRGEKCGLSFLNTKLKES